MNIATNWIAGKYKEGDESHIIELFEAVFGRGRWGDLKYWNWKYKENPAGFYSNVWIAKDDEKVVGHYGIIPVKIKVNDKIILGAQAVDAATHPEYRRQGMFDVLAKKVLTNAVDDGIVVTYAYSGIYSLGVSEKLGYKTICSVPVMYKILNFRKAFSLKGMGLKDIYGVMKTFIGVYKKKALKLTKKQVFHLEIFRDFMLKIFGIISDPVAIFRSIPNPQIDTLRINKIERFDDRINKFWEEVSKNYEIIVKRDKKFLNWRYVKNPRDNYTIFLVEKENKILGYIVLKINEDSGVGEILDVLALPNYDDVFICLINKSFEFFKERNMYTVSCWMSEYQGYYKILKKMGFFSYKKISNLSLYIKPMEKLIQGAMRTFIIYVNSPKSDTSDYTDYEEKKWFLSLGDSDLA